MKKKYYVLFCDCGCNDPILGATTKGEFMPVFRTRELAEMRAADLRVHGRGTHPFVGEIEVAKV